MRNLKQLVVCASHSPGMALDPEGALGRDFRKGLDAARTRVQDFAPDLIVLFGGDHRRAFAELCPTFAVMASATALGDLGSPEGQYNVPSGIAGDLAQRLVEEKFDVALGYDVGLDHGFGQTMEHLLGDVSAVPVIPVFVNCASPPLPACDRVWDFGAAVGSFCSGAGQRVLYVGSGGLSHSPPSLEGTARGLSDEERRRLNRDGAEGARAMINPEWDHRLLGRLSAGEWPALRALSDSDIATAGVGAHEVRTWLAAVAAGGAPLETLAYEPVPEWITGMGVAASEASC